MKIDDPELQRHIKREPKTIVLSIRITPTISKWLKEKNLSPTGVFYKALNELGYQGE